MKQKLFTLTTLATLLVSLLIMPSALAEEPEPGCPGGVPMELKCSVGGGPRRPPDGKWYEPAGAISSGEVFTGMFPGDTGGPDDFGYTWDDSVAFNWVDATGGTNSGLAGDDQWSGPVNIGFDFKFYENTYSQLYFNTNGYVTFGAGSSVWSNQSIPSLGSPNNFIAPFWDDLCVNYGGYNMGSVYYSQGGTAPNRYFVVEWYAVSQLGETDLLTFETILYENGDILMQYHSMAGDLSWAVVGIEDSIGVDGLEYGNTVSSNLAIRFTRPGPLARVKVWPLYQGRFASAGEIVAFQVPIYNTGELGSDTYDISVSSPWIVNFYAADGTTSLTDTDGDSTVDTGAVAQGSNTTIVAKVETPSVVNVGDDNTAAITFRSSLDTAKSRTVELQTAVPAPFAQVYRDSADGAMSLDLVQPDGQTRVKTTSDGYWGYGVAVAEMPASFAYVWYRDRSVGSLWVNELEYTLRDSSGNAIRGVSKLTDHSGATMNTYDYRPAVAAAPNGNIGVVWYRYLYNPSNYYWNYNVYYAILDSSGNIVVPPTNLTNNTVWGYG
jgi:hypothetical protein